LILLEKNILKYRNAGVPPAEKVSNSMDKPEIEIVFNDYACIFKAERSA